MIYNTCVSKKMPPSSSLIQRQPGVDISHGSSHHSASMKTRSVGKKKGTGKVLVAMKDVNNSFAGAHVAFGQLVSLCCFLVITNNM